MQITVPGEEISSIIKKLWKLELFSDINFYINYVRDDKIGIEIEIKAYTSMLNRGLKKGNPKSYSKKQS